MCVHLSPSVPNKRVMGWAFAGAADGRKCVSLEAHCELGLAGAVGLALPINTCLAIPTAWPKRETCLLKGIGPGFAADMSAKILCLVCGACAFPNLNFGSAIS